MRGLLILLLFSGAAFARDDDGRHAQSEYNGWFRSLTIPGSGGSCCDLSDCKRTEYRMDGDHYEAVAPDKTWIAIPPESVIYNKGNPTGEPILCARPDGNGGWKVLCFVPGGGV